MWHKPMGLSGVLHPWLGVWKGVACRSEAFRAAIDLRQAWVTAP
jgi:hypothetical protein